MADLVADLVEVAEERNKDVFLSRLPHCDKDKLRKSQVLHIVCRNGWLDVIKQLIINYDMSLWDFLNSSGAGSTVVPHHGGGASPTHLACTSGNLELVQYLIDERSWYVTKCTDDGLYTIYCAIMGGLHIVKYFLEHPLNLKAFMFAIYNLPQMILFAYYNWDNDLMKYLIVKCECSIIINKSTGDTVLHYVCRDGYIARLWFLIEECKCDSRVLNRSKHTLLYTVCSSNNLQKELCNDMLIYLTAKLDSFDIRREFKMNEDGLNTVECAIILGWEAAVKRLVVLCDDQDDKYSIISFAYYYWDDSIMRYLISELGIVTNGITGNTLLHNACRDMSLDKIRFVEAEMPDVTDFSNIVDTNKNTLLHAFSGSSVCTPSSAVLSYLKQMCKYSINAFNYTPLEWAIIHQTLPMLAVASVRCLVKEYGSDELHGGRILALAFQHWSDDMIKYLLVEMKCSPVTDVSNGDTILHMACRTGNIERVKFLIETCHYNPHVSSEAHNELLIRAASNDYDILRYLCIECDYYADLSGYQDTGIIAMQLAIVQNKKGLAVVKHLVEKCKVMKGNWEITSYIYENWCSDIVKYIIVEAKFDACANNANYNTLLHLSAANQDLKRLKYLIDVCHCSPHIQNNHGESLIHAACRYRHYDLIDFDVLCYLCINCNCCPDLTDHSVGSRTVGTVAMKSAICQKEKGLAVVKHLVGKCKVKNSCEIMSFAWDNWCEAVMKYLIVEDANFDLATDEKCSMIVDGSTGDTVLHYACLEMNLSKLKFLLEECMCNIEVSNLKGETILHTLFSTPPPDDSFDLWVSIFEYISDGSHINLLALAFQHWSNKVIEYLLVEKKCSPVTDVSNGDTILHMACRKGNVEQVKFLVETCHCNPHVNSHKLFIQTASNNFDILQYLCIKCNCQTDLSGHQKVGTTAMKLAIAHREKGLSVVKHLVEKCKVEESYKILSFAWLYWCEEVMKYLIVDARFDLTIHIHTSYSSILHCCIFFDGHFERMEFLIETCHCISHIETLIPALIHEIRKMYLITQFLTFYEYFHKLYYLLSKFAGHHVIAVDSRDVAITIECCYDNQHEIRNCEKLIYLLVHDCMSPSSQAAQQDDNHDMHSILYTVYKMWHKHALKCLLLDKKCNMIDSSTGDTVLHYACSEMSLSKLKFLLEECKCDIEISNFKGETILHELSGPWPPTTTHNFNLWFSIVAYIIEFYSSHLIATHFQHCQPDDMMEYNPVTDMSNSYAVLHIASQIGNIEQVKFLIEICHCNPHFENSYHNAQLLIHAAINDFDVLRYLCIECDCYTDLSGYQNTSTTAMKSAITHQQKGLAVVKHLVEKCKVESSREIMSLVYENWCPIIVKYLLVDKTFDLYCDTVNNTLLHLSAMNQDLIRLKYLIDVCHCSPHIKNDVGESLIHAACRYNNWIDFDTLYYLCINCNCCPNLADDPRVCAMAIKSAIAQKEKGLAIVKHLVEKCKVESSCEIMSFALDNWCEAVMKYLIVDAKFDLTTDIHTGYTVLHHCVCFSGSFKQIKFLMETCHCTSHIETLIPALLQEIRKLDFMTHFSMMYFDKLHYLLSKFAGHHTIAVDCHDVAETVECCYYNQHQMHNCAEIIYLLVQNCIISPFNQAHQDDNHDMHSILSVAYKMWHKDALKFLLLNKKYKMIVDSSTGDTVLHYACSEMNLFKLEFLLEECNLCESDAEVSNLKEETILHTLCTSPTTPPFHDFNLWFSIVKYVIETYNFPHNLALQDKSGNTVFHLICSSTEYFKPFVIDYLLKCASTYDLNLKNNNGYTVLHLLCQLFSHDPLNVDLIMRLIQDGKCNPLLKDPYKNSILHILACHWLAPVYSTNFLSLIHCLLYDCQLDITLVNNHGDTVLHVTCRNFNGDIALIERIISTGKANMLAKNYLDETPLMLLDNRCRSLDNDDATQHIKQLIARFGEVQLAHPIHSYVNIVLLGNPEVGKSTLCKVIESRKKYTIAAQYRNVKNVELHTAGIITKIIKDNDIGRIILHDLAGQTEYYSSHTAVLENLLQGSAAVFVAVVSLADTNCIKSFHQWFNIIKNVSHNALHQCRLIVVASHIDQSVVSDLNQLKESISDLCSLNLPSNRVSGLKSNGIFKLDCRKLGGGQLLKFISALSTACKSITDSDPREMSLYCHMLYDFFQRDGKHSYTLESLMELSENNNGLFLPNDIKHVESIVSQLGSTGLVVYLRSKIELSKSWVVVDKSVLLSELNGILFAPQNFKQYVQDMSSNTGVVKLSHLYSKFLNYDPELLLQFLQYMELCSVISGEFLTANMQPPLKVDGDGQYIFVPALIKSIEKPDISQTVFKFGWCFCCTEHTFFISRFIHLVQLHLACKFSNMKSTATSKFERLCKVWTKGIYWQDTKGVEALVEVTDSNQALLVFTSCKDGCESDMFNLIHDVIAEILSCKQQVMPQLVAHDFVINYSDIQRSLDSLDSVPLYSVKLLATCFLNNHEFIIDDNTGGNQIGISNLVAAHDDTKMFFNTIFAGRDPNCLANIQNMAENNAHYQSSKQGATSIEPLVSPDLVKSTENNPPISVVGLQADEHTTSTCLTEDTTLKEPLVSPDVIVESSTLLVSPFQILKSHTPQLLGLISDPHKLATDLWSADLLSDATKDEVETNTSLNRYKKANCVLSEITRLISSMDLSQQIKTFEMFCSVLKSQGDPGLERISNQMIADMKTNSTPNISLH